MYFSAVAAAVATGAPPSAGPPRFGGKFQMYPETKFDKKKKNEKKKKKEEEEEEGEKRDESPNPENKSHLTGKL